MSNSKRARLLAAIIGSGIVVASSACADLTTVPTTTAPSAARTPEGVSTFSPTEASKALVGVVDGVYTVTFNPALPQSFALGPNKLEIPANAVCKLVGSGYGPAFWNSTCTPERLPVTLTVTIKGAKTASPIVEFKPAMRFHPATKVSLHMYVPNVSRTDATNWAILYCGDDIKDAALKNCVNEALTDRELLTYVDYSRSVLFRRVKHFSAFRPGSGYVVAE